jgi:thiol:disulfide interchange protein DsbC
MRSIILSLGLLFASSAWTDDVSATIIANLKSRFPEIQVTTVKPIAQLPGLYEIVAAGGQIVYADRNADYIFSGRIIDARTKEDLTTNRWTELHRIEFATLPLELAIKTVRGNGSRRLAVFADPRCPYCEQLEQALAGIHDVTIYTFLFPLESLHPGARAMAVKIWCSPDRSQAWSDWMLKRVEPQSMACSDEPIAKLAELASRLEINSTPTLYLADGRRLTGAMSSAEIESNLNSAGVGK